MAARQVWLSLLAVVALSLATRAQALPIEGKIVVSGWDDSGASLVYVLEGTSSTVVTAPWAVDLPDISPDLTKVTYDIRTVGDLFHAMTGDVWVANFNGTGALNLTGPPGLGGVNCVPTWSPDGSMIAFQHAAPAVGQVTCEAGFQVWLMNADGTDLRQWLTAPGHDTWFAAWASDGFRLLAEARYAGRVTADINGDNVSVAPGPNGQYAQWSRDGSKLVYSTTQDDVVSGEPGVWRQLVLADPDGSNPQVLVQQFVSDSDIEAHIAKYDFQPADHNWLTDIRSMVGPHRARWSPRGNQLAFIAAMPFDPSGPMYWFQREVWIYDRDTGQCTRVTTDENWDNWISWGGPNTSAVSPEVTVNNTTIAFDQVQSEGLTTIIRDDDPPALPAGYAVGGPFYRAQTTAQISGPITLSMTYQGVAGAAENYLSILHYNEATSQWDEVTTSRDTAGNIIHGQTDSLGVIGLSLRLPTSHFPDISSSPSDPFWALWDIEAAYAAGIVAGYDDGLYHPERPVTRDQMAVYIARAKGWVAIGDDMTTAPELFPDVPAGFWCGTAIQACVTNDVVKGYGDGTFGPDNTVTRDQMAVFIARSKGWVGIDDNMTTAPQLFPDVPAGFWCGTAIQACVNNDVVHGYEDGKYHPELTVTRDQMAVFIARAFNLPL